METAEPDSKPLYLELAANNFNGTNEAKYSKTQQLSSIELIMHKYWNYLMEHGWTDRHIGIYPFGYTAVLSSMLNDCKHTKYEECSHLIIFSLTFQAKANQNRANAN